MDGRSPKRPPAEAARSACERLYEQLLPWFGVAGCDALFRRALAEAQATRPAMAKVRLRGVADGLFAGIDDATAEHGADAVAAGLHTMHANLLELLSRMIGADLSARILAQSRAAQSRSPNEDSTR